MSIKIENLTHLYMEGTPFERKALNNITLEIKSGELLAIIGHTGSGKSTLVQHFNAILKPTSGKVIINGTDLWHKKTNKSENRKEVGLVFQYPEYQLFEETVEKDIAYGPKNLGLSDEDVRLKIIRAMNTVGLNYESFRNKSPFELSGGEKRRVAIAGVVAMEPKILILDEPTAGLDPSGRDEILNKIKELHEKYNNTTIVVSHSMEDVAKIANRIIVMSDGGIVLDGTCSQVFNNIDMLENIGLAVPSVKYLQKKLLSKGIILSDKIYTIEEAKKEILKCLRGKKND